MTNMNKVDEQKHSLKSTLWTRWMFEIAWNAFSSTELPPCLHCMWCWSSITIMIGIDFVLANSFHVAFYLHLHFICIFPILYNHEHDNEHNFIYLDMIWWSDECTGKSKSNKKSCPVILFPFFLIFFIPNMSSPYSFWLLKCYWWT